MQNPLVRKLEQFARLSDQDQRAIQTLTSQPMRRYELDTDIVREGDASQTIRLVLSGWACRYKQLPNGRRQVIALLLPGDLCDHNGLMLSEMDHSIGALTDVTMVEIPPTAFEEMTNAHSGIARALHWESLVNAAVQREWMLNLGQRVAAERLAHVFCEVFYRLRAIGLTQGDSCEMPLTQSDLADVIGMTPVHVNRVLQTLRAQELVVLRGHRLIIPDLAALERVALFTPNYLHLGGVGARFDA